MSYINSIYKKDIKIKMKRTKSNGALSPPLQEIYSHPIHVRPTVAFIVQDADMHADLNDVNVKIENYP